MAKKNYEEMSKQILEYVGGKENISFFTHCVTRLRFNVRDKSRIKEDELKKITGVLGVQWSGEQLQIIIGNEVSDVYESTCRIGGFKELEAINENLDKSRNKLTIKKIFSAIMDGIVGSMVPALPALIGCGLIQAFTLLTTKVGLLTNDSSTVAMLTLISDSVFYFMPVIIGFFAARKFNLTPAIGAVLGAMLVHPNFNTMVASGETITFFGMNVPATTYTSSVLPAIIIVYVASLIEKVLNKYTPKSMKTVIVPFITILVMAPLSFCFLASISALLSTYIADFISVMYNTVGPIAVGLLSAFAPLIVMTGMHVSLTPIAVQNVVTMGADRLINPSFVLSNFAQGGACLAVGIKSKIIDRKSFALSSSFSDVVPGISEPGMYGITLRYKTPLYGSMIGGFMGGLYFGIMKVGAFAPGAPNIFVLPGYIGGNNNLLHTVIGIVITFFISFIATLILYKEKEEY